MRNAVFAMRRPSAAWLDLRALDADRPINRILAYAVPALAAFVAVQTWLEPGTLLGSGDLAPLLTPGTNYRWHWNQFSSGTGSATYDLVMLPLAELQRLSHWFGVSDVVFQQFWVTGLFTGVAAAAVYLTFGFVDSPLAAGTAGVLATFNGYRMTTSFDTVPLVATIAAAVLGGMIVRAARGRAPRAISFALFTPLLALSFVNPPHLALVGVWLVACSAIALIVWGRPARAALARFLGKAIPLAVLVSLWWIVPVILTLTAPTFNELFAAPGISEWKFTHHRASIGNVLKLRSQWGWDVSEYYPYGARLDRLAFEVLSYFLPLLAALGAALSWRRARRLALALAIFGATVVWVAKGIHPPLNGTNWWLYHHVPGFFLLREPAKVLLLLVFVLAILGGLAVQRLASVLPPLAAMLAAAALVVGATLYAHPLFTGEVVPDNRSILPPAHVRVPQAWREAAAFLNRQPEDGKVLVLPRPDFYALPTTWGYYGPSFARVLIHRGVIEPLHQSYFRTPASVFSTVAFIEENLAAARGEDVKRQMQALGARYVLLRRDLAQDFQGRHFSNPDLLARGLSRAGGFNLLRSFGLLDVYRLEDGQPREVFTALPVAYRGTGQGIPAALDLEPKSAVIALRDARRLNQVVPPVRRLRFPDPDLQELVLDPRDFSALQDCDRYNAKKLAPLDLAKRVIHREGTLILQLQARHHSACVTVDRALPDDVSVVRLKLNYRAVSGSPARVCLWEVGPERCALRRRLALVRGWRRFSTVVPLDARTKSVIVYLYADGPRAGVTVTEYEDISLTSVLPPVQVGNVPAGSAPTVSYRRVNPGEFRVHVEGASGSHLLVAGEAWAPGWWISAKGHDSDEAAHVRVNGYENGWLVPWRGSYDARLFYEPERFVRAALWTIPLYLMMAAFWLGQTVLPRRRRFSARRSS